MSQYEVSTLKKGLQILELLKINRFSTLTETAKELQLSKTTAFRLLKTLENMEYIKKKDSYFELNREMFLASPVRKPPIDWTALKSPYRLGMSVGESVYIGTLDEEELVMQQIIKPPF